MHEEKVKYSMSFLSKPGNIPCFVTQPGTFLSSPLKEWIKCVKYKRSKISVIKYLSFKSAPKINGSAETHLETIWCPISVLYRVVIFLLFKKLLFESHGKMKLIKWNSQSQKNSVCECMVLYVFGPENN